MQRALFAVFLAACGTDPRLFEPVALEVQTESPEQPAGSDAVPRQKLAFRFLDGSSALVPEAALAHAAYRNGAALIDAERRLLFVSADGQKRVLAEESGAPPVRGPLGELVYVSKHELEARVHVMDPDGRDRVVLSGLANAGLLAPQPDGRIFFVGAVPGGVAGLWVIESDRGRCLSNCALRAGKSWGDGFVPLPAGRASIRASASRVEWDAADGSKRELDLGAKP